MLRRFLPPRPALALMPPAQPFNGALAGRRRGLLAAVAFLTASAAARTGCGAAQAGTIFIAGTGGAIGTMRVLAEACRGRHLAAAPEIRFLPNLGTTGGIAAALEGTADIALAGRPPTERERAAGARARAYARTPFAFAVHPEVSVRAIALEDAIRIYAGELLAWPDGTPIRLVRRPPSDSDTAALVAISPAMARAVEAAQRRLGLVNAATDQDSADALEAIRGSFGTITLAQFLAERRRLTLLALDGVEPSTEALAARRYPLAKTFYAVTREEPAPAVAAFLDFLAGPEARAVLARLGQEPVSRGGAV